MLAEATQSTMVIFDNELSPGNIRALEEIIGVTVIDRSALILDIFAQRAKTKEGRLQVELAQYKYLLPRLSGMGASLSRQGGGIGTRGPGETKLESDRRHIRERITRLEEELEQVRKVRAVQRERRMKNSIPVVAIVGYTNAGKSTLLNQLTNAGIPANNRLFDTLDTTSRQLTVSDNLDVILSDTVGFISKLPHALVKAFHSTLEEAKEADLLLQIIDYSDEHYREYMKVTEDTLRELGADTIPMIYVFNKADKCGMGKFAMVQGEDKIFMSAKSMDGIDTLLTLIEGKLAGGYRDCELLIPYTRGDIVSYLNDNAVVYQCDYREDGVYMHANLQVSDAGRYEKFILK